MHQQSPWIHRQGVLWHEPSQCDLLFVTLNKSENIFPPTTRYRDLALSDQCGAKPCFRGMHIRDIQAVRWGTLACGMLRIGRSSPGRRRQTPG